MPDARVQAAISNWAPRFTAQGVNYNDFISTTSRIETWDQWLDEWVVTGDMHAELAQQAETYNRILSAGEAWVRVALSYHFAKFVWVLDKAKHDAAADSAIAALYNAHRHLDPTAERLEIPYEGTKMVANIRRPADRHNPPVVILLPGLDSTKEEFFYWEAVFLKRGMATLSLEGPGQGETGLTTHIRPDYEVAVSTAIDFIQNRTDIDLNRIGIVGVSLGGYYAPRAAAYEKRIKAVVPIGGPHNVEGMWGMIPMLTKETFVYHTGSTSEDEAFEKIKKMTLADAAKNITQPMLIIFGKRDRLIPYQQAERLEAEAPNARLVMYENGNHVCNNIPYKYRPLVGDWMQEQLG